ncbi:flavin-containing monooxygenase [Kineococcus sp. SYSU DK003]|uniref:flavin-containing monooxygenase n=1 Tax=Kineococcus sp. SYSU DK003 TaxID=3383124 RepID=UPI003D7DAE3D
MDNGAATEHFDVLVVGAGLSGVGAACQLRRRRPGATFAVLEARGTTGGTWDLFRYPGVRSDSDMYTLGYSFRPWTGGKAIADGASIRQYIADTAREFGLDARIRYHHRVVSARFRTAHGRWTVVVERPGPDGGTETATLTCGFLVSCTGYYRYDRGYAPQFPGTAEFTAAGGRVVHPQHWPGDLDVTGRRVVVIGSGATAVTLVPNLAPDAAHVTMLQRSPSWVLALSSRDHLADRLRGRVPARLAYSLVRAKHVAVATASYQFSRRRPEAARRFLRERLTARLPQGFDVDRHFTPRYDPWDQRVCFVPDGDLFRAVRAGAASVVTDGIETFTADGVRLASGAELPADVVVTATGLDLLFLGGMHLEVDGRPVDPADRVVYRGMMLSGVPNFAFALGYTNASWTLKIDLVTEHVCRLLALMERRGHRVVTPGAPRNPRRRPLIDLRSGYVRRAAGQLPQQGVSAPWRLRQNYPADVWTLRHRRVDDRALDFS